MEAVRLRSSAGRYFLRPAVQFTTTVMGTALAVAASVIVLIRNPPSGATSYGV